MQRLITSFLCACVVLATLTASGAVKGSLTLKDGKEKSGLINWDGKKYVVQIGKFNETISASEVQDVDVDEPAKLQEAIKQKSIPELETIVKEYAHLKWDKVAGRYLAEAYLADGKPADARKVCDGIIDGEPSAAYRGDLAPAYWSALLGLNRDKELKKYLENAMKSKDRFSRGAALIMRGDIAMKEGNESPDACKKALIDGYLRVVYLYKDEEIANKLQPEALYKAARCFEKLGLGSPATTMREELKTSYPDSPWANR